MNDWWKIGILVVLLGGSYGLHRYFESKAVNTAIVTTTTTITKQYQDKLIAADKKAADAVASMNAYKAQKDQELVNAKQTIDAQYADTISQLQQRPTRADLTSGIASAVARAKSACTGAQLFKEDGGFLAGEAARADKVIADRDYYYGQYENARRTLAGQKPDAGLGATSTNSVDVSGNRLQH